MGRRLKLRARRDRVLHHVTSGKTSVREVLEKHFKLDRTRIDELFALGAVHLDKKRVLADRPLDKGAHLIVHLNPRRFATETIDWKKTILKEGEEFLVVNKPSGVPVHATSGNLRDNLLTRLREATGLKLLITQRLDTPVGGVMVLAKTPAFQSTFNKWLSERKVEKRYRALVPAAPPLGLHVHYMEPSEKPPRKVYLEERPGWLRCELSILSVQPSGERFDAEIELHTGRTHQIRAQLSLLGFPIVGDKLYGSRVRRSGVALFSARLAWPGGGPFTANPPW